MSLNESPSEKEGKYPRQSPSLSVLWRLNESPSEKEGKYYGGRPVHRYRHGLNESPSEKEGKSANHDHHPNQSSKPQ